MKTLRSVSLQRYRVDGTIPTPSSEAFLRRLRDRKFRPLGADEERTYGWVSPENLLVTEFDPDTMIHGRRVLLAFRIDRRRVNARLLRAHLDLEVRARMKAARDAGTPFRFPREERQQVRKDLHAELLRNANPSVESHTAIYDPEARCVTLLTLTRTAHEAFRVLFQDTFGADLRLLTPARRAVELLAGTPALAALDSLRRSEFHPGDADVAPLQRRAAASGRGSADAMSRPALREVSP